MLKKEIAFITPHEKKKRTWEKVHFIDGTVKTRIYGPHNPRYYKDEHGDLHPVDVTALEDIRTGVGNALLRRKYPVSVGIRKDGKAEKYLGLRPDETQALGTEQMEWSVEQILFDQVPVIPYLKENRQINNTTIDLGNVVVKSTRHYTRQMVKVDSPIVNFLIRYKVNLKGLKIGQPKAVREVFLKKKVTFTHLDQGEIHSDEIKPLTPYKEGDPLFLQTYFITNKVITHTSDSPPVKVGPDYSLDEIDGKGCYATLNYKNIGIKIKGKHPAGKKNFKKRLLNILQSILSCTHEDFGEMGIHLKKDKEIIGFVAFSRDGVHTTISIKTEDYTPLLSEIPDNVHAKPGFIPITYSDFMASFLPKISDLLTQDEVKVFGDYYFPNEFGEFHILNEKGEFKWKIVPPKILDEWFEVVPTEVGHLLKDNGDGTLDYIKYSTPATDLENARYIDGDIYYSTTADGYVSNSDADWATCRGAASGASVEDTSYAHYCTSSYSTITKTNTYTIARAFLYFDTTDVDNAGSADLNLCSYWSGNVDDIEAFTGTQAATLSTADFDAFNESESWGAYTGSYTLDDYITITLSDASYINNAGITKCCYREQDHDVANSAPALGTGYSIQFYSADDTGAYDPYLEVTEAGYGNKVIGQAPATIAKINGIARASINKVIGQA